jgi:signal recognition particle receptor subunit beta
VTHDAVNHPSHYTSHPSGIECLQITRGLQFDPGNATKYVWRADLKTGVSGVQDLLKAEFYLEDHLAEFGGEIIVPDKAVDLIQVVLATEVKLYGAGHPRVQFWHSLMVGGAVQAVVEVRRLITLSEEAQP